jgi:hypothetical protein
MYAYEQTNRLMRYIKLDLYDDLHQAWFSWKTHRDAQLLNDVVDRQVWMHNLMDEMDEAITTAERGLLSSQAEYALFSGLADVPEPSGLYKRSLYEPIVFPDT